MSDPRGLSDWNYGLPPGSKPITMSVEYQRADAGQEILRTASASGGVVYVRFKRAWRDRLFSWPWRPWVAYVGQPVSMRVTKQELVDGEEGMEAHYTLEPDG